MSITPRTVPRVRQALSLPPPPLASPSPVTATRATRQEVTTASGLKIKKLVNGNGPLVEIGDLVGVRFKGNYGTYEFDNIFTTAEPYYMRAGVNTLVPASCEIAISTC